MKQNNCHGATAVLIKTKKGTPITCRTKRERKPERERKLYSSYSSTFHMLVVAQHPGLCDINIYFVGAGISTLMSFCDGLDPCILLSKDRRTRSTKEEMEGKVFISRHSWHFSFVNIVIEVLCPICTLNWRVNNYACGQGKFLKRETKVLLLL